MSAEATRECVEPDGRCHAPAALVHGCDEPVGEGLWSCHHHFAQAYKRGQEILAERVVGGNPSSSGSDGRGRTAAAEKAESAGGRS